MKRGLLLGPGEPEDLDHLFHNDPPPLKGETDRIKGNPGDPCPHPRNDPSISDIGKGPIELTRHQGVAERDNGGGAKDEPFCQSRNGRQGCKAFQKPAALAFKTVGFKGEVIPHPDGVEPHFLHPPDVAKHSLICALVPEMGK